MNIGNKRLIGIIAGVGFLLLIPYIAMRLTGEMKWSANDFIAAGVLLLGTCLACELVLRKVKKVQHRIAICAVVLLVIFIIWAELAVGLIGTPFAGS